mmetsp:Transcript_66377/g.209908  ORF Transcript_66377/g.209908 Transcript_66377/m.209908 type:complete len:268 (+) Transcript_66377:5233-6036(+)
MTRTSSNAPPSTGATAGSDRSSAPPTTPQRRNISPDVADELAEPASTRRWDARTTEARGAMLTFGGFPFSTFTAVCSVAARPPLLIVSINAYSRGSPCGPPSTDAVMAPAALDGARAASVAPSGARHGPPACEHSHAYSIAPALSSGSEDRVPSRDTPPSSPRRLPPPEILGTRGLYLMRTSVLTAPWIWELLFKTASAVKVYDAPAGIWPLSMTSVAVSAKWSAAVSANGREASLETALHAQKMPRGGVQPSMKRDLAAISSSIDR